MFIFRYSIKINCVDIKSQFRSLSENVLCGSKGTRESQTKVRPAITEIYVHNGIAFLESEITSFNYFWGKQNFFNFN